jgi:MFS superfamily sulfate permease-like transporter
MDSRDSMDQENGCRDSKAADAAQLIASAGDKAAPGRAAAKNRYDKMEWAGAFGDIGTLIPFVVAYITIVGVEPLGLLFMFGVSKIVSGLYYKTPVPIQPMKAIGAAAIAGGITPGALFASGLTTGLFWLLMGWTGAVTHVTRFATKPVVRGITLGLGLAFIVEGIHRMTTSPVLAGLALATTFLLLGRPKFPAMFVLLFLGVAAGVVLNPALVPELARIRAGFKLPVFTLHTLTWQDFVTGTLLFTLPQIPLTLGNAVICITAENNELFPDRPVTEEKISISQGIMNLVAPLWGGVPMCHGAGGMAGHVRFGARTGGSLVILGCIMVAIALFFSDSVTLIFKIIPNAVLGVILFFAGAELAVTSRDIGEKRNDVYVMLVTAGFAMWHMGAAFLVGAVLDLALRREWIKL